MDVLKGLNDVQKSAVLTTSGPLLLLAGAGSGKTKTLTHRIAYLIGHERVQPEEILAVTFTNKAAREMRERLWRLVANDSPTDGPSRNFMPWMGTFHSICIRILRADGLSIGVPSNFVIYDEDDRRALIKQVMAQTEDKKITKSSISGAISRAKNEMILPEDYMARSYVPLEQAVAETYPAYEKARREAGALDFDDILLETVRLLSEKPEIATKYQEKFRHIFIDEYQDTNAAQYAIVKKLVGREKNICVVGDDWQSIYSWRGADFKNILNFERDFPGAKVVKLEQNYRSTSPILEIAQKVIVKNIERTDKELWTAQKGGAPIEIIAAMNDDEEAYRVAQTIERKVRSGVRDFNDFAVLYRTNSQSAMFERMFSQFAIPYKLIGSRSFLDREVVKDLLAHLKLIHQPLDRVSFMRIVNKPKRGAGQVTIDKFLTWQTATERTIIAALCEIDDMPGLSQKVKSELRLFGETLSNLEERALEEGATPSELIDDITNRTMYYRYITDDKIKSDDRLEHASELAVWASEYANLDEFLSQAMLVSSHDAANSEGEVALMTVHAAKGLEFPVVFIVGMEQGLFPLIRRGNIDPRELEEERRLCYVSVTRAREELYLAFARQRRWFGQTQTNLPSQFLDDMEINIAQKPHSRPPARAEDDFFGDMPGYEVGDRVRSRQFGTGEIVDVDGLAVSVRFDNGATKLLNVEFARLEKM